MTPLAHLEIKLLQTLPSLNLRPTLDRAAEVGRLLSEARPLLPHGEWLPWLRRVGLHRRTAHDYLAVFSHIENVRPAAHLTIKQFLEQIRKVRHLDRVAERERVRDELSKARGGLPPECKLVNADCRHYDWPTDLDAVCTDPPWTDLDAYAWLASWCRSHVKPGGPILVQASPEHLPEVMSLFAAAGLTYQWTLCFAYLRNGDANPVNCWRSAWRPVLLYSVGGMKPAHHSITDTYNVQPVAREHHPWEQPVAPFKYWLSKLVEPGALVADPFAGSGTTAVAARECGLRFIGTEVDKETFRVAQGRLAKAASC